MKNLAFDDLTLFTRVAALGTLSAAARERDVPVSVVSRALARIERECGAVLLHRSTHGLTLTAEGEAFHVFCQRAGADFAEIEAEFASRGGEPSGRVRVSCSAVWAHYQIVPSLRVLMARYPKLEIQLFVDDRIIDMAREGIDIAIRTGEPTSEALVMRPLGVIRRRLYASPDYLAQHGTPERVEDLSAHQLLTNCGRPVLNRWRFQTGHSLLATGALQSDNTAILAEMAVQGLGIARLVMPVGEALIARGLLRPVLPDLIDEAPVELSAVMLAARHRLPKVRACVEFWREHLAS